MQTAPSTTSPSRLAALPTLHFTPTSLGLSLLRLHLYEVLRSPVFTDAERARAPMRIGPCQEAAQLLRWHKNVTRVHAERGAPTMWIAQAEPAATATPLLPCVLAQDVAGRAHRGRTSDYAGELHATAMQAAFTTETGLTWADVATL